MMIKEKKVLRTYLLSLQCLAPATGLYTFKATIRQPRDYFYIHQECMSIIFLLILRYTGCTLTIAKLWPAAYGVLVQHELLLFSLSASLR